MPLSHAAETYSKKTTRQACSDKQENIPLVISYTHKDCLSLKVWHSGVFFSASSKIRKWCAKVKRQAEINISRIKRRLRNKSNTLEEGTVYEAPYTSRNYGEHSSSQNNRRVGIVHVHDCRYVIGYVGGGIFGRDPGHWSRKNVGRPQNEGWRDIERG